VEVTGRSKCNGKGYSSISSNEELLSKKLKRANRKENSKSWRKEVCEEEMMVVRKTSTESRQEVNGDGKLTNGLSLPGVPKRVTLGVQTHSMHATWLGLVVKTKMRENQR
jgi:hypothetical protein